MESLCYLCYNAMMDDYEHREFWGEKPTEPEHYFLTDFKIGVNIALPNGCPLPKPERSKTIYIRGGEQNNSLFNPMSFAIGMMFNN